MKATGMGLYLSRKMADDLGLGLEARSQSGRGFEMSIGSRGSRGKFVFVELNTDGDKVRKSPRIQRIDMRNRIRWDCNVSGSGYRA